jgi:hypothetical protein
MAALRQSIEAEGKQAAVAATTAAVRNTAPSAKEPVATKTTVSKGKKTAKRNSDQREMLLPIPGGAPTASKGAGRAAEEGQHEEKGGIVPFQRWRRFRIAPSRSPGAPLPTRQETLVGEFPTSN